MVYIPAGIFVNLHRNSSHHFWQHTGILYISSSCQVKSAFSHSKTSEYVTSSIAEMKSHLWEYSK